ncbi:DUF418 domain-containing protein [Caulobacter sp. CCUG 60055]|uniref:DUF418 domain-containing protein n=1 Tax=Caulobacter sp. CCUG 60055 TaxID=2100090 RepID=UPI001FA6F7B9|nr:DUF418 domain-containing protein [Caulobacter sp. CCUG 60055]MCI3182201.1 DUF418 domain-containing protein [Caulobacter sp. CCUG 60055]
MNATQNDRLAVVDALRGFALLGILMVNIGAFSSTFYGLEIPDPKFVAPFDRAVQFAISALFETKFYLLFSFLFGYSFTLQMSSSERTGRPFAPQILRRLATLWVIGLIHAALLYHGDILTTYALLGLVLLAARRTDDRLLLSAAGLLVLVTALCWASLATLQGLKPEPLNPAAILAEAQAEAEIFRGSPAAVVAQHLRELSSVWGIVAFIQAPCALAMFLLGLVAGRRKALARVDEHLPKLRLLLAAGLAVGLPGALFYAWTSVFAPGATLAGLAVGVLTAPALTGAYLAGAVLLFTSQAGARLRDALAPAGRMALSNYLSQSFVCAMIFYGYGLGWIGRTSPSQTTLIALALFAIQLFVSRWWMDRFAYGPLEWLLRAATTAAWPPWRKAQQPA